MLGRPASWAPVWKKVTAGSWLIASVCIDLMKQSSSATRAVCGKQLADSAAPLWPCRANAEPAGRDREAVLPRGHAGQPLAHPDRVGQLGPLQVARAPACDRTGPSATARPTGTGRSPAWPAARSSGNPSMPAPAGDRPPSRSPRRARDRRATPGRSSPARPPAGRRSAGA